MAVTSKLTTDLATRKLWNEKLWRDFRVSTYFDKFTGDGPNSPIQEKMDLAKTQGDEVTFTLINSLSGAGVTGTQVLTGNEEQLTDSTFKVTLERYRNGVTDNGDLYRRRPVYQTGPEIREKLKLWAAEKVDKLKFDAYGIGAGSTSAQDPTLIFYNTNGTFSSTTTPATAVTAMAATTKINSGYTSGFGLISGLRTWATTGGAGQQVPLQPIKVEGEEYLVLLTHPDALYDLKMDPVFQTQMQYAQARGKDNPLFRNAVAIIDGVVIHAHKDVFVSNTGGGGSQRYTKSILLGAQSLVGAWGEKVNAVEEDYDYEEFMKYAVRFTCQFKKPKFNSKDYGSIGVFMSCSAISNK